MGLRENRAKKPLTPWRICYYKTKSNKPNTRLRSEDHCHSPTEYAVHDPRQRTDPAELEIMHVFWAAAN